VCNRKSFKKPRTRSSSTEILRAEEKVAVMGGNGEHGEIQVPILPDETNGDHLVLFYLRTNQILPGQFTMGIKGGNSMDPV